MAENTVQETKVQPKEPFIWEKGKEAAFRSFK